VAFFVCHAAVGCDREQCGTRLAASRRAFAGVAQKNLCAVVLYGGIGNISAIGLTTGVSSATSDAAVALATAGAVQGADAQIVKVCGALEPPPPPPLHTVEHLAGGGDPGLKTVTVAVPAAVSNPAGIDAESDGSDGSHG